MDWTEWIAFAFVACAALYLAVRYVRNRHKKSCCPKGCPAVKFDPPKEEKKKS